VTPSPVSLAFATAAGGLVGSVLTSCIRNLPRHEPVTWPPRTWSRYGAVEMVTAALFAGALWYFGVTALFLSRVVFGCALIILFATDLEHQLLPNAITVPGIVIGLLFSLIADPGWRSSLIGVVIGGGVPFAVAELYYRIRGRDGLGFGDVKMLAMIGAFLGWPAALITLMLASIAGSIAGLVVIVLRRGDVHHAMPFGTFLAVGAAFAATLGSSLVEWLQRR
jgi:leader peptidase (prepilin peptidase)/N-methyltransferase